MKKNKLIVISIISTVLVLALGFNLIYAYYTDKDSKINKFSVGKIEVMVTEPNYVDNELLKPKSVIVKDPTLENTGEIPAYLRAQVYVPIANMKYIDEDGNVISPTGDVELFSYELNSGWEVVVEDGFSGIYEDEDGNKYSVYTYKFVENGVEKIVNPGEKISVPVFSSVEVINYLDVDKEVNAQIHVCALGVQTDGGSADELWTYFKNQNGTGVLGV